MFLEVNVKFTTLNLNLIQKKLTMMHSHVDEANVRFTTLQIMKLNHRGIIYKKLATRLESTKEILVFYLF